MSLNEKKEYKGPFSFSHQKSMLKSLMLDIQNLLS